MSNNYWIESYDVILLWNDADKNNDINVYFRCGEN